MSDLVNGQYPVKNSDWLLAGQPAAPRRVNMSRIQANADLAALTTQVCTTVAIPLLAGDIVTNLSFKSGATAMVTPTNWWMALYDSAGNLLQQSADQLAAAWAADTTKTLALAAPVGIVTPGIYFATIMVKATTVPTLVGTNVGRAAVSTGMLASDKVLAQTHGAALTTTAPATITAGTAVITVPYVVTS